MGKCILVLLFGCIGPFTMVFSQSNMGKEINDIKRDGQYFFAESTLNTEKEAHESAILILVNFINDYINNNKLPSDKKVTEKDLTSAKSLTMARGSMTRVFLYVKKDDFVSTGAPNKPSIKEEVVVQESIKEKTVTENTQKQDAVIPAAEVKLVEEVKPATKIIPAVEIQPVTEVKPIVEVKSAEAPKEPSPNTITDADSSLRLSVEWQQTAVDSMLKESSLKGIMTLLNRLKAEYKVKRFGTYNECGNAALSFWIICENNNEMSLITILGPGSDARVNFKTLQYDSLGNYSGKNAIWFELAK